MSYQLLKINGDLKEISVPTSKVARTGNISFKVDTDSNSSEVYLTEDLSLSDGNMIDRVIIEPENQKERLLRTYFSQSGTGQGNKLPQTHYKIKAPMPGLVRSIKVSVGDNIEKTSQILVLEAMKMENSVQGGQKGKVIAIFAREGKNVEKNEVLAEIEVI